MDELEMAEFYPSFNTDAERREFKRQTSGRDWEDDCKELPKEDD